MGKLKEPLENKNPKVYVVGIGPGGIDEMTPRARRAVESCEVVAGYGLYIDLIRGLTTGKEIVTTGMAAEIERCEAAILAALSGKSVCVVSGGDPGLYGMAGLVLELAGPFPQLTVEVIPGVTAACAASAALGAPISKDFAAISLSDRLTDWRVIEKRLHLAAQADFVICLYNPASNARKNHLRNACSIILEHRSSETACGIVRAVGREGEKVAITTLGGLFSVEADMLMAIIIGSGETYVINGRLVTPRGYPL